MNPLVSICCATYNHESYISKTIEGFLCQITKFRFEIIIHDDASTDLTAKIVNDYALKNNNIKAIIQPVNLMSQGINPTIDHIFKQAKGKYIALCDGDDYWTDPYKLQKQVDVLDNEMHVSLVAHRSIVKWIDGSESIFPTQKEDIYYTHTDMCTTHHLGGNTSSLMFRKSHIEGYKSFGGDKISAGDWTLCLYISQFGIIKVLKDVMSVYRKHENGIYAGLNSIERSLWRLNLYNEIALLTNLNEESKKLLLKSQKDYFESLLNRNKESNLLMRIFKKIKLLR